MVFETICDLLAECLGCGAGRIREDTVVLEDLECTLDDLGEVLLGIEEELGVAVPEELTGGRFTVGDLVRCVEELL